MNSPGTSGTPNTGGGGGGASTSSGGNSNGGDGGSGIVVLRYLGTPRATGGTITQNGGYTIHSFTGVGTNSFTISGNTNDIDGDGIVNSKDLDSDGDGCFDVAEAGLSDPDGDGMLGDGFNLTDSSAYNFINGSYANEYAGRGRTGDLAPYNIGQGVDISADGNIVIYGARDYGGSPGGSNSGHAAVYKRTPTGATSWSLIGDFYGDTSSDYFGQSVSINGKGDIVAIGAHYDEPSGGSNRGAVYIYQYNSATASWSLLGGAPLTGSGNSDYFGTSLSLNHQGNRIAVGVPFDDDSGTNRGSIIVYQYNTSTSSWDNIGQVVGKQNSAYFGFGVKMNKAGDRFVASAPYDDQFGSDVGTMRVYQYGGGTTWNQVGADMRGYSTSDYYGTVAINAAGDRVAFSDGERGNDRIFIYGESGGTWSQLGTNGSGSSSIYNSNSYFGASIDFNERGNLLGVGTRDRVYFYEYNGSTWSQKGSYLDKNNSFGASIALSASGNIYAASMPDYDPPGLSNAGRILVIGQQLSVSASGTVISDASGTNFTPGTNAYLSTTSVASITDADSNNVKDFLEVPQITITGQPTDTSVIENYPSSFTVTATSGATSFTYQWQYATSVTATTWTDITESNSYSGSNSATLNIPISLLSLNGYQFRVLLTNSCGGYTVSSTQATLTITLEDCDSDGTVNNLDPDDDNDGVLDANDLYPCDPTQSADTDGDGIGDGDDIDDDNDGILDTYEDSAGSSDDIDGDGIVNSKDLDSDGDGCFDVAEAGLSDPDGDGMLGNGFNLTDSSAYNFINGSYANEYAGRGRTGDLAPYNIGQGVDISADGNIVIYGARDYGGSPGGSNSGHAAVYKRTPTRATSWSLIGDFYGDTSSDYFGQSVSINGKGDIVAIGAHYDEPSGGSNRGAVYIYQYNSATASWSLLGGAPLTGSGNSDYFGTSLSLNHQGNRIAVGVPFDDDSGTNRGSIIVYQYNTSTSSWDNIGQVVGKQNSAYFGLG